MSATSDDYQVLLRRIRDLFAARAIERLLDWDHETYMPPRGAADRAEQLALIAGLAHEKLTSDELGGLLSKLEAAGLGDDPIASVNVRELRRDYDRAVRLPKALVEELARATTMAKEAWSAARKEASFARFAPHLERILE